MARLIARRLVALVVVLLVLSLGIFALLWIAPEKPIDILLGGRPASPAAIKAIQREYHLNAPFLAQYWRWLSDALQLNLGRSIVTEQPVTQVLGQSLPLTLELALYGFTLALLVGVPAGVAAALLKRRPADRIAVALSVVGVSAPAFATGIALLYVFAVKLGWFPAFGPGSGIASQIVHLTLPACSLALTSIALILKLTRASMIEALDRDFIVFARARGLPARRVVIRHALRNALIPLVTASGSVLAYMIAGVVVVEVTFALPGMGSLLVSSILNADIPVVQGAALVTAVAVVSINLLVDLLYLAIDPRVRLARVQR